MSYTQSITRSSRALFVVAIDQSGSMAGEINVAGRRVTKAEMVAEVANDLIAELVERSRRSDGVRDYYDVAIVGYSGDGVESLLTRQWVSIIDLDRDCLEECDVERECKLPDGSVRFFNQHMRRWITPKATGSTPMYECLLTLYDLVGEWCSHNRDSFPPMIFNITDGESTDCDYDDIAEIASKIKSVSTNDGAALLVNIHIASVCGGKSLLFPTLIEFAQFSEPSRSAFALYNSASDMPPIFNDALCEIKGVEKSDIFKAMSYNCAVSELITILNIGSISVKRG